MRQYVGMAVAGTERVSSGVYTVLNNLSRPIAQAHTTSYVASYGCNGLKADMTGLP